MGILLLVWTGGRAGKTHRPVVPRFARSTPVVQQGGIAGHAARAGAPKGSRLKVILELKSALEEDLTARLGLARMPTPDVLASKAKAAGLLDAEEAESLVRLLRTLSALEGTPGSRRRAPAERMRNAEVVALAGRVKGLLAAASAAPVTAPPRAGA
jgi:hypothetical protein